LLCFLLGIREPSQITRDPLVGSIFENLIVVECLKARYNKGHMADLYFFRDSKGNEVDLLAERGRALVAIEIKSAVTFSLDQLKGLRRFQSVAQNVAASVLVYRGDTKETSDGFRAIPYTKVESLF
jgi:predicted AAA+ superfamily ATPase